jgi:hypothetical protein
MPTRRTPGALRGALAALLLAAAPALAAPGDKAGKGDKGDDDSGAMAPPAQVKKEGDYGGVTPAEASTKAKRPRRKKGLQWIGFQPREGGGRVFVMAGEEMPYSQAVAGGALLVELPGARFGSRNATRPLDTRFFGSTVARIVPRRVGARRAGKGQPAHKAGVELRIEFKNPADAAEATVSAKVEQDGYFYVYLDFPAAAPSTDPAAPPPVARSSAAKGDSEPE